MSSTTPRLAARCPPVWLTVRIISSRSSEMAAVVRAFYRARQFADENPEKAYQIMAGRERISVVEFQRALDGIELISMGGQKRYLAPGGELEQALAVAHEALRATGIELEIMPGALLTMNIVSEAAAE